MEKLVAISVINDVVTDQRLGRSVGTFRKCGFAVVVFGRRLPGSLPLAGQDYRVSRMRLLFKKGPLFYAFFNTRLFFRLLLMKRPVLLMSNDLDTLPANYLVSKIRGIPLLYDSHELFTEVPELVHRRRVRKIWLAIEKRTVPGLKYACTVSESIAREYADRYGVRFEVIRNFPHRRRVLDYPEFHDRYPARYKVIYQGALNVGRGLELLIHAMKWTTDTTLLLVGDGDIRPDLRALVIELSLEDRVVFPGRLQPHHLHKITCQCNLGFSLEEDLGLNYRYALPNKIFDYIQAGIPVLCSDLPEMSDLVRKHGVGEVVDSRDPKSLAGQMMRMLTDAGKNRQWQENLGIAGEKLNWKEEEQKLKGLLAAMNI